jgi:hypothetical protein
MFFPLNISLLIRDLQLIFYDRSEVIDYALQEYRIKIRFRESRCKRAIYTVELPTDESERKPGKRIHARVQ